MTEVFATHQLNEEIDKEYDLPIKDKSLGSLFVMNYNFDDLRKVIEFLLEN